MCKIAFCAGLAPLILAFGVRGQPLNTGPARAGGCTAAALGKAVSAAWESAGGKEGRLGCPLASEGDTATSIKGTTAREARFQGGVIVLHTSGPLAGKAFAVAACDRLYVQYGGPSGWLGLPVSDPINTPDGQRQRFEGGTLMLYRALGACEADRAP